jgi:hypothetical protein
MRGDAREIAFWNFSGANSAISVVSAFEVTAAMVMDYFLCGSAAGLSEDGKTLRHALGVVGEPVTALATAAWTRR